MKITVIDSWNYKFSQRMMDWWKAEGHEITPSTSWGPHLVEGSDVTYYPEVENNLKVASHKSEKPKGTTIIAEAVDIDIYAGHLGAVDWSYVDHLVFMSKHMQEFARKKYGAKIADMPQTLVPGGMNLDEWTLRERPLGYNVAWIGRLWIPKDVFGALMVFHELINQQPNRPWQLFLLHDNKWHPEWYRNHTMAYVEANPQLEARITWVRRVPDVNMWLEDMDYLLQTGQKEALGYVNLEAAAKGIRPIIRNTNGALDLWPREWIFDLVSEAVTMFKSYDPQQYRDWVADHYPLEKRMRAFDALMGIS